MKLTITTLLILVVGFAGFAQNSTLKYNKVKTVNLNKVQGYLEHLPPGYANSPTKKYPLLVFLHGAGERGSSPSDMYKVAKNGPPKEIENGGSLCFNVNGKQECFIVISPQLTGGGNWTGYAQKEFWDYILNGPNNYRYDPNRIYLTGLSLGGNGVWERAYDAENGPNKLAAIAPLCAWGKVTNGCTVSNRKIPVWAFHGTSDNVISYNSGLNMFNAVKNCNPSAQTKWTAIQGGEHWIWNDIYKTDNSAYSQNLYQWFLTQSLNNSGGGDSGGGDSGGGSTDNTINQAPVVDAGDDVNTSISEDLVYLIAEGSDPDGAISSFQWKKISGPAVTLWNANRAKLTVKDFVKGTYEFEVVAKDNQGKTAADRVLVSVTDGNTGTTPSPGGITKKTSSDGRDYLEYLPAGYSTSAKYPVIVYLHSGEAEGSNTDLLKTEGPLYFANQGKAISANGESFIVLSPQIAKGAGFWKGKIDRFYEFMMKKYSIDPNRVYIVGYDEGAIDALFRITDNTNTPNRWAAAAVVSYNMPYAVACQVGSSGPALYMANGKMDQTYTFSNAQTFYNKVDNCTSNTTRFVTETGDQAQSWKRTFDPGVTTLYSWLLNQKTTGMTASSARTGEDTEESSVTQESNVFEGNNFTQTDKNYRTDQYQIVLTSGDEPVRIKLHAMDGRPVRDVQTQGELSLDGIENGIYLYSVVDQDGSQLQRGRIVKH